MSTVFTEVIDGHAHIFEKSLPMVDDARYVPDRDALLSEYLSELDRNGFTHGVLVQPSFLGANNDYLLAALDARPNQLRGVAVVLPTISEHELGSLAKRGIVGIRLNLVGKPLPNFHLGPWPSLQSKLQRLGMHVEIHSSPAELEQIMPSFLAAGNILVIDHFGRPDGALGLRDPGFRYLLNAGSSGQVWVKLSALYRLGKGAQSSFVSSEVISCLRDALGMDRLVWGSDWPHTQHTNQMDFRTARRQLDELLPKFDERAQVLGQSAKQLFRI